MSTESGKQLALESIASADPAELRIDLSFEVMGGGDYPWRITRKEVVTRQQLVAEFKTRDEAMAVLPRPGGDRNG